MKSKEVNKLIKKELNPTLESLGFSISNKNSASWSKKLNKKWLYVIFRLSTWNTSDSGNFFLEFLIGKDKYTNINTIYKYKTCTVRLSKEEEKELVRIYNEIQVKDPMQRQVYNDLKIDLKISKVTWFFEYHDEKDLKLYTNEFKKIIPIVVERLEKKYTSPIYKLLGY